MTTFKKLIVPKLLELKVGDIVNWSGCFTLEPYILNKSPIEIAFELGLPAYKATMGFWILRSKKNLLPGTLKFHLGGSTRTPTNLFIEKGVFIPEKFEKLYPGLDIVKHRNAWKNAMSKRGIQLVKVVSRVPHFSFEDMYGYPMGRGIPQIIVTNNIECEVVTHLREPDKFQSFRMKRI